jgi:hypothetical protein
MCSPTFGGDVRDVPTNREVARGFGGIADRHRNTGVTSLMTMCSPSVSTHVWVVCGEPSGINVVAPTVPT